MNSFLPRGRAHAASWFLLILSIAFLPAVTACHHSHDTTRQINLRHQISPWPAHQGPATVSLQLTDANAYPVSHAHISVEGDMTHPGMAPIFSDASETSPGTYKAQLNFTMGGDWVLVFHVTLADGSKLEKQADVKGVESR